MASLRTELGGAIGILLVLYAIQVQRGPSSLPVTIWIDNAEVLSRAGTRQVGDNINQHLVLDYDLWRVLIAFGCYPFLIHFALYVRINFFPFQRCGDQVL